MQDFSGFEQKATTPPTPLRTEVHSQGNQAEMQYKMMGDAAGWGRRISWGSGKVPLSWVSTRLREQLRNSGFPLHKSLTLILQPQAWAATLGIEMIEFCGSPLVCVIKCLCMGHSEVKLGLYDWAAPVHLSPNTDLLLFFPAWISCISLCMLPGCTCHCRLCQCFGICLLEELMAAFNTPSWASSLLQFVLFALAAMPHLVLNYTDNW